MSSTIRFEDGDIQISNSGAQTWVSGAEKSAQDTLLEVLTPYSLEHDRGNEMFLPDGRLTTMVGGPATGISMVRSFLRQSVGRLMSRQAASPTASTAEKIQAVKQLVVAVDGNDPTAYLWYLETAVNDENIGLAREIKTRHLGDTPYPLVGGYDP